MGNFAYSVIRSDKLTGTAFKKTQICKALAYKKNPRLKSGDKFIPGEYFSGRLDIPGILDSGLTKDKD